MSNKYNETKAKQLGMPWGTASSRLKKNLLFKLVKETKQDNCFKCGLEIENVDELSIEHKISWLHNDVNLFWDLDNIAFSHLKCNRPDSNNQISNRKFRNENESWCSRCKDFKDKSLFSPHNKRWNGLDNRYKSCKAELIQCYRENKL